MKRVILAAADAIELAKTSSDLEVLTRFAEDGDKGV